MLYYTRSVQHIARKCTIEHGNFSIHEFPDGELDVEITDDVANKSVWILADFCTATILELLLLLDALQRGGARCNLMFTYYGYARQDRLLQGHSLGAEVIARTLQPYNKERLVVVHAHSDRLHEYLTYENYIPYQFFFDVAESADMIVAPDQGALPLAQHVAESLGKEYGYFEKKRLSGSSTEMRVFHGEVAGKRVLLLDDMISTGGTLFNAAESLRKQGALYVSAAATHGLFVGNALDRLEASAIDHVFVTNTFYQKHQSPQLTVVDIAPLLCQRIKKG